MISFLSGTAQLERTGTPISWNQELELSVENEWLGEANVQALLQEDEQALEDRSVPYRFAYAKPVDWTMENSGSWTNLANGDRIWILGITYEGARSIAISIGNLNIPKGGKLYLYSDDHLECVGPLTDADNTVQLMTLPHIQGSTIFLEYYEPRSYRGEGSLTVQYVAGAYRTAEQDFEPLQNCNQWVYDNDVMLSESPIQSSVVQVLTDFGQRYASAVLVNNSANDGKPYVILPSQAILGNPSSLLFRFGFVAPVCMESLSNCEFQFVCGANVVVVDESKGLALLELSKKPLSNWDAYYAGWHVGDHLQTHHYCIQHPKGLIKSYSHYMGEFMPVLQGENILMGLPGLGHGQSDGGSVGSPLFDEDLDIVGVFVGGNTRCGIEGGLDRFILLEDVWSDFSPYLNPLHQPGERIPGMQIPKPLPTAINPGEILLYPNPAEDFIQLAGAQDVAVHSIHVYNSTGKIALQLSGSTRVDVSSLPPGVYLVRVHTDKGAFANSVLVTKK